MNHYFPKSAETPSALSTRGQKLSPLCVDLDGTVLTTDVLWESVILLCKHQPWILLKFPFWLVRGRAYLKQQIAQRVILDPAQLPYRQEVLSYLYQQKEAGRLLVLVTASDYQPAEAIATYLGIFSEVMASDGVRNLSGTEKRLALEYRFGAKGFDYIGDSRADLAVWSSANAAILVGTSQRILKHVRKVAPIEKIFPPSFHPLQAYVKALRIHQWVKNVLVFLPLLTAHLLLDVPSILHTGSAFVTFSLCASSLYLVNDLLDLQADRRHPQKRLRPLATGALPISTALVLIPILFLSALLTSWAMLPKEFSHLLGLYSLITFGYSFLLKQSPIIDVLTLAGLYTLRIFAGGIAIDVPISSWLLAFSMFFFLSLAFGKRHSEIQFRKVNENQGLERRGYLGVDKEALATMGTVSGYLSVLVLAFYINSPDVLNLYHHPQLLWLICPLLLYWISRNWLLAQRGNIDDDPVLTALKDPQSYSVVAAICLIGILAI